MTDPSVHYEDPMFLNVDLVIIGSGAAFSTLTDELATTLLQLNVSSLDDGAQQACFETNLANVNSPNEPIAGFATAIDGLTPKAMEAWRSLRARTFDLGFQTGVDFGSRSSLLDDRSLATVARLGGRVQITLYQPVPKHEHAAAAE